jgi:hypothetical protein
MCEWLSAYSLRKYACRQVLVASSSWRGQPAGERRHLEAGYLFALPKKGAGKETQRDQLMVNLKAGHRLTHHAQIKVTPYPSCRLLLTPSFSASWLDGSMPR